MWSREDRKKKELCEGGANKTKKERNYVQGKGNRL